MKHVQTLLLLALLPLLVPAADRYWDGVDTTADANGGNGAWDTAAFNWDDAATGGANAQFVAGDNLFFGGAAGTVTLGAASMSAGTITFNTAGYTLASGGNNLTIGALAGTGGFTKTGAGTFQVTGSSAYTGATTINGGTLSLEGSTNTAGNLNVNNSGSKIRVTGALTAGNITMSGAAGTTFEVTNTGSVTATSYTAPWGTTLTVNGTMSGGAMTFSTNSANTFNGAGTVNASSLTVGNYATVNFGGTGTYNVSGNFFLNVSGQTGFFNQSAGTVNVTGAAGTFRIAHWNVDGAYTITGGTLNSTNKISVGWDGNGTLNVNGGLVAASQIVVNDNGTGGTGTVNLTAGELRVGAGGIASVGGTRTINLGAGTLSASASWSSAEAMILTDTVTGVNVNTTGGTITLSGVLSGAGRINKGGSGTFNLTGGNTYTGATTVNGGTLALGTGAARTSTSFTVNPGATLSLNGTNLFVAGHGVPLAAGRVITVNNGTLLMPATTDTRFGNVVLNNGSTWTSDRVLTNYDALLADTDAGPATVSVTGAGASVMNGTGGVHLQGVQNFNVADVTGSAAADLTVSMRLDGPGTTAGAAGGLNKTGAGTMVLSGNNTYNGATNVSSGTLLINGTHTGGGLISVSAAATLGGSGNVGAVTVADNGILSPGSSAGHLTVSDLTLNPSSVLAFELGAPTLVQSAGSDFITVTSTLTLDGLLNITPIAGFGTPVAGDKWLIMTSAGGIADGGVSIGSAPSLGGGLSFAVDASSGADVYLTVVPEAGTGMLAALGLLVLRRRYFRS